MSTLIEHRLSLSGFEPDPTDSIPLDNDAVIARSAQIDWAPLSPLLSPAQISLINEAPDHQYNSQNAMPLVEALLTCLKKCTKEDIVQFTLVIIEELLQRQDDIAPLFYSQQTPQADIYSLFLRILGRSNYRPFTINRACSVLSLLFSLVLSDDAEMLKSASQFGLWLGAKVSDVSDGCHNMAMMSLKIFLKQKSIQTQFAEEGGLSVLAQKLQSESSRNTQLVYQCAFCLWILSFNESVLPMLVRDNIVPVLVSTLQSVSRDKVARVILCCLRNITGKHQFNEILLGLNVLPILDAVELRTSVKDPEMHEDLTCIRTELLKDVKKFSSFEVFRQELFRDNLKWSPVHTQSFWEENFSRCDADGFAVIKRLIELLDSSDSRTIAIACFDLGEFARFYPSGRQIVRTLGGQEKLMQRMSHESPDVQQHALLCVQKLMINNWSGLQRQ